MKWISQAKIVPTIHGAGKIYEITSELNWFCRNLELCTPVDELSPKRYCG